MENDEEAQEEPTEGGPFGRRVSCRMAGTSQRRVGGTLERPKDRFDEVQGKPLMETDGNSLKNRNRGLK